MNDGFDIKSLKGLTQDSRQVKSGFLFGAFLGAKVDGRDYIAAAIQNGASAILAAPGTVMPDLFSDKDVMVIESENPRQAFAKMAAEFYGRQPEQIVAITGTNGKTSCAHFVNQLWQSQGLKSASVGTLGVSTETAIREGSMTTPDAVTLHGTLADMAAVGVDHLVMEASSHGLDQYRLDGVRVKVAAFTNLSRDHLDYHENMDEYFQAKARLFSELIVDGGTAVLNADIPEFDALKEIVNARGFSVVSYGFKGEQIKLLNVVPNPHGQTITAEIFGDEVKIDLPLVGEFQAMNVLCSLGLVLSEGLDNKAAYVEALSNLQGVPGRLDHVGGHPKGAAIYVDYAHTPDALETVLKSLRPHTSGRLICLFGCGGNRDVGKRPVMGRIASEHADRVIITDDNPRTENPDLIRRDILKGAEKAQEVDGRSKAIHIAVADLQEGDVLLIAGKGHEQGQIFADHTEPFDDREEAEKAIGEIS